MIIKKMLIIKAIVKALPCPAGISLPAPKAPSALALDSEHPQNVAAQQSVRLTFPAQPQPAPTELINSGYWGINARKGAAYQFSAYIKRSVDFHAPIHACPAWRQWTGLWTGFVKRHERGNNRLEVSQSATYVKRGRPGCSTRPLRQQVRVRSG